MFSEEELEVDSSLGYPPVYAKLCRHAVAVASELPMPFTEGAPQRFLPYSPQAQDFVHLKEWDNVFPIIAEREKDSSHTRKHAEELWQQLDHLGNAGFDPAKFRVDPYGNVVYWNADNSSPLAWDIDHWFPYPRGGKTVSPNLRIVQWQACSRKRNRLEFLVPWWDLQHGCSINQFLSAFAAKNADFRKRSFALFFAGGEDEAVAREHVGECRPWPQQFREKKALCGLAAAAIVNVSTAKDNVNEAAGATSDAAAVGGGSSNKADQQPDVSRILGAYPYGAILGTASRQMWSGEEEEALKRGVSKFGAGNWKEIKENEVLLASRSVAQIKEKFRSMRGASRTVAAKNGISGRQSAATTALQKELRVKIMREEERREREEELAKLEEVVTKLKLENEKERVRAAELEGVLKKHKHRVEKHRKWAESQSSYRLCLERVLRDTMHQTMSYKEQARLTREACNVLIARLDSQKSCCEAMEHELLQRHSQRELLMEAAAAGSCDNNNNNKIKVVKQGREIVDVSSCVSLRATAEGDEDVEEEEEEDDDEEKAHVLTVAMNRLSESSSDESDDEGVDSDEVYNLRRAHQQAAARKSLVRHAIKVAMQVEDTKGAVNSWGDGAQCVAKGESEYCDSDFADDEMSPALRLSRDENDVVLGPATVSVLSEIRTLRTLRKPTRTVSVDCDQSDLSVEAAVASAGESSLRSDQSKQDVVQKDVIMVQEKPNFQCVKQEYLDELLQHIRFQIPTSETVERISSEPDHGPAPPYIMSEGHLDELLEQALRNHLERNDAKQQQQQQQQHSHQSQDDSMVDMDDEKVREIGKSNLDKWLQLLLFKGVESSTCSSPGRCDTTSPHVAAQIVSPRGLSHISVAAMRESLERATHQEFQGCEDAERSGGKGLWGAILRKLSVKHQSEEQSSMALFEPKENYHTTDEAQNLQSVARLSSHEADIANAMISLLQRSSSPGHELTTATLAEGRTSTNCTSDALTTATLAEGRTSSSSNCSTGDALSGWPGGITGSSDHSGVWKTDRRRVHDGVVHVDYQLHSMENKRRYFPKPLSDVDEISETESIEDSPAPSNTAPQQLHRPKKRVSIKVAGFVQGWKSKSSKKGSSTEPSPQSE